MCHLVSLYHEQVKKKTLLENTSHSHSYKICPKHTKYEVVTAVAHIRSLGCGVDVTSQKSWILLLTFVRKYFQ